MLTKQTIILINKLLLALEDPRMRDRNSLRLRHSRAFNSTSFMDMLLYYTTLTSMWWDEWRSKLCVAFLSFVPPEEKHPTF